MLLGPFLLVVFAQDFTARSPLRGIYFNTRNDLRLVVHYPYYELDEGSPLTTAYANRSVVFENGILFLHGSEMRLRPNRIFKSPCRDSEQSLLSGGMICGYERKYRDKKSQEKFLSELKWRIADHGQEHSIVIRGKMGRRILLLHGVELHREVMSSG